MKTDYDVIIVGAGPAGTSCAKYLVDNGVKTLILEKCKLPRYKCCGGYLTQRSLEVIKKNYGNIPLNITCENSKAIIKVSKTGKSFVELPNSEMLKTYRIKFVS